MRLTCTSRQSEPWRDLRKRQVPKAFPNHLISFYVVCDGHSGGLSAFPLPPSSPSTPLCALLRWCYCPEQGRSQPTCAQGFCLWRWSSHPLSWMATLKANPHSPSASQPASQPANRSLSLFHSPTPDALRDGFKQADEVILATPNPGEAKEQQGRGAFCSHTHSACGVEVAFLWLSAFSGAGSSKKAKSLRCLESNNAPPHIGKVCQDLG